MKRSIGTTLALVTGLVIAGACVENKGSLQVKGVMAPPIAQQGMGCVYDPQATSVVLPSGTLDVAFATSYTPIFLVQNQMVQTGNATQLRVETNNVQLEGATVRITDAVGNQLANYTTTGAGFVYAANGTTPGFGAVAITILDNMTIQGLRTSIPLRQSRRLITYSKVFGHTLGGLKIEAAEFQFPVDVCNGCLVTFPADGCSAAGASSISSPCSLGQDQPIDCRLPACSNNPACAP